MHDKFYHDVNGEESTSVEERIKTHPCYNPKARFNYARIHLPIAPKCNIQCGFCNRLYDCVNESRPGVTSNVIKPDKSVELVSRVLEEIPQVSVVGIAGPGDPLANPEETFQTIDLINKNFPKLKLCLSTNGLTLPDLVDQIVFHKVKYLTITINAIDSIIAEKIYPWINFQGHVIRGKEAAEILLARQQLGLQMLVERDVLVKINTVLIPGINDSHIPQIAEFVSQKGAYLFNIVPLIQVAGTQFENWPVPDRKMLSDIQKQCSPFIRIMQHCKQCRADAIGFLGNDHPMNCFVTPSGDPRLGDES